MLDRQTKTTRLQGVGLVNAVEARELVVGDRVMFNYGVVYILTGIVKETAKTLTFTWQEEKTGVHYDLGKRTNKTKLMARCKSKEEYE